MKSLRHNCNTRNSFQSLKLRKTYGAEGYGVYVMLKEFLCELPNLTAPRNYEILAYHLDVPAELIRAIVEDFDLFVIQDNEFTHASFLPKIHAKEEPQSLLSNKQIKTLDANLAGINESEDMLEQAQERTRFAQGHILCLLNNDFRHHCITTGTSPTSLFDLFNAFYAWLPAA